MVYLQKCVTVEALQLTWENWNKICDFIPKENFIRGCYVDPITGMESQDAMKAEIGLFITTNPANCNSHVSDEDPNQQFLVRQNQWIVKDHYNYLTIMNEDDFKKNYSGF